MKLYYTLLFLLVSFLGTAQQDGKQFSNHRISVGLFDPIKIPGNDVYFNDNWLFANAPDEIIDFQVHKRKYLRYALSLSYEYSFKNNFSFGIDFGTGIRNIKQDYIIKNKKDDVNTVYKETNAVYQQISYGINLIASKSILIKNFELHLGLGLSYWLQGVGNQDVQQYKKEFSGGYYGVTSELTHKIHYFTTIGDGHNAGLITRLGVNYHFSPLIAVGLDLSWHVFYSIYNNFVEDSFTEHFHVYDHKYDEVTNDLRQTGTFRTNIKFRQFSFSNLSPRLKVIFKF